MRVIPSSLKRMTIQNTEHEHGRAGRCYACRVAAMTLQVCKDGLMPKSLEHLLLTCPDWNDVDYDRRGDVHMTFRNVRDDLVGRLDYEIELDMQRECVDATCAPLGTDARAGSALHSAFMAIGRSTSRYTRPARRGARSLGRQSIGCADLAGDV